MKDELGASAVFADGGQDGVDCVEVAATVAVDDGDGVALVLFVGGGGFEVADSADAFGEVGEADFGSGLVDEHGVEIEDGGE